MTEINYWLMKSEPEAYSIKDLKNEDETLWDGIRNYQARKFLTSNGFNQSITDLWREIKEDSKYDLL